MKTHLLILCLGFMSVTFSQSLNDPESVVYDPTTDLYYVSNHGNGTIQKQNADGSFTLFASGLIAPLGLVIQNNVLYVADQTQIKGYTISTQAETFSLSIPGTSQLNDLTFDQDGYLYVSDRMGDKIFKIDVSDSNYSILNKSIVTPNGIFFDAPNNRLLICNTIDSSSIYAVSLSTGVATELIKTGYSNLDGLVKDSQGNVFVTSWSKDWQNSKLLKFNSSFELPAEELLNNSDGMADIYYNSANNSIAIANWLAKSITFFEINTP